MSASEGATGQDYDFFLAYPSPDRAFAQELFEALGGDPGRVFMDKHGLEPGDHWDDVIPEALEGSRIVVVLISRNTPTAHYQRGEIADAVDKARKDRSRRVVPVYLPGYTGTPYGLRRVQGIKVQQGDGMKAVADRLIALLSPTSRKGNQPRKIDGEFTKDSRPDICMVLVSESRGTDSKLYERVGQALNRIRKKLDLGTSKVVPATLPITQAMSSVECLRSTIHDLCQARFVVFDMTSYEPAMMLLLGIRAVARRGVTVVTVDHELPPEKWVEIPFSLKQISPIENVTRPPGDPKNTVRQLADAFLVGSRQLDGMPNYLDLPAYDDVRRLGPNLEDFRPKKWNEQVLWMCSFSKEYLGNNYGDAGTDLIQALGELDADSRQPEIRLIIDIASPRLMSQRTYEAIRLHELCVIDWTQWRPNVFYEFGVRLAVSPRDPLLIYDPGLARPAGERVTPDQEEALIQLFQPVKYGEEDPLAHHATEACQAWVDRRPRGEVRFGEVFELVHSSIPDGAESTFRDVHEELLSSARALVGSDLEQAGRLPVLFGEKSDVRKRAIASAWNRTLAAWLYLAECFASSTEEFAADSKKRAALEELSKTIQERLNQGDTVDTNKLGERVALVLDQLAALHTRSAEDVREPLGDLIEELGIEKQRAQLARKRGHHARVEEILGDAIKQLRRAIDQLVDDSQTADDWERRGARLLTELYGILGGALREREQYLKAARAYDAGHAIEADERYGFDSSYNALNRLVMRILHEPRCLEDPDVLAGEKNLETLDIQGELEEIECELVRELETVRAGDVWARGDLGLVRLLLDKEQGANSAWSEFEELAVDSATRLKYASVVGELADRALPESVHGLLAETLARLRARA